MQLQMKEACEKCGAALRLDGEAFICSHECTFCGDCATRAQLNCPHCGGELVHRPKRRTATTVSNQEPIPEDPGIRPLLLWGVNLSVWVIITLAAAVSLRGYYRSTGSPESFLKILTQQSYQMYAYALLTPFVFSLAMRYPIRKENWIPRALTFSMLGIVFIFSTVALRAITPYAFWDRQTRGWVSAIRDPQTHALAIQWHMFKSMLFINGIDDLLFMFVPILSVAHVVSYYRGFRERTLHASQLEAQLSKAHLQSLKSQLQPHFLFNTLHSISALMFTNPTAADRMITRLSELLRMNLENDDVQLTTLSQELDFVNGYLAIEKIRFEDRLTVVMDISPDVLDATVPHLVLQPLVENAVRHGISRRSAPGCIRITARHESQALYLQVKDNGLGLQKSPGESLKHGLGLRSTRERLETLYGRSQSLVIRNVSEGGVEVNVRIPFTPSAQSTGKVQEEEGPPPAQVAAGEQR